MWGRVYIYACVCVGIGKTLNVHDFMCVISDQLACGNSLIHLPQDYSAVIGHFLSPSIYISAAFVVLAYWLSLSEASWYDN